MVSSAGQLRVFVVDDNAVIASSLAMILRIHSGFEVSSFTDPVEALQLSKLDTPDLLISDMLMPKLSGIDLAVQLLEHCPKCKVMLLSGDSLTAASSLQAQRSGHEFEVLIKPVHPADMLSSIQRIMDASPAQLAVNGA